MNRYFPFIKMWHKQCDAKWRMVSWWFHCHSSFLSQRAHLAACYTCVHTRHTDTNTHRLPGLCHGAAVAATSPRAPAHTQLLLRLPSVKVVCEFPETRHLSCLVSPPPLCLCFLFSSPDPYSNNKKKKICFCSAILLGTRPPDLPPSSTWLQQHVSASATGPSLPELPSSSSSSVARQKEEGEAKEKPCSAFSLPLSSFDRLQVMSARCIHWLSRNSIVCNCLPIQHGWRECPPSRRESEERERERGRWWLRVGFLVCCWWWEKISCNDACI